MEAFKTGRFPAIWRAWSQKFFRGARTLGPLALRARLFHRFARASHSLVSRSRSWAGSAPDDIFYRHTDDITETNRLILAAAIVVQEELGVKRKEKKQKMLWWKKGLCDQVASLRKDLSRVDRIKQGKLKNQQQATRLEKKYNISKKGIMVVAEELKQRIIAVSAKIKRYNERHNQFVQNRLFQSNQKRLYEKIDGVVRYNEFLPEAEECRQFWRGIWEKEVDHNRDVKWLDDLKKELNGVDRQSELTINTEMLVRQLRKIPNWKAPGLDGVQGYWLKNFNSLRDRIKNQLDNCVQGRTSVPKWMTSGRTTLIMKDTNKGTVASNFRPITCLPLMWKLLTGMIADSLSGCYFFKDFL